MDWNFLIRNKESLTVTTDSRRVTPGCVFVALRGEHFDGNDFVAQALTDGATLVLMEDADKYARLSSADQQKVILAPAPGGEGRGGVLLLQDLARAWRRELGLPIIGITGTNGKTTTKELLAAVLATRFRIHYTQGNLNNSLGVPLTLLQCTRAHEMAIVEMGASHPGDIRELVEIAEPNYGLITNVGRAHLQGFGSFEGVMRTKAELYDYLLAHGETIFLNADNPHLKEMLEVAQKNVNCQLSIVNYHSGEMPDGTHLVGEYNAENIQAALCVGEYFGISREQGLQAIRAYVPTNNRSQHTVVNSRLATSWAPCANWAITPGSSTRIWSTTSWCARQTASYSSDPSTATQRLHTPSLTMSMHSSNICNETRSTATVSLSKDHVAIN